MREKLESFHELCKAYDYQADFPPFPDRPYVDYYAQISASIPTVREIVKRLDPKLVDDITEPKVKGVLGQHPDELRTVRARQAVMRALGVLDDRDEWEANLAPDAPSLIADHLHPYVWSAASAIWDTGNYRLAVQQAAVSLSTHIAHKAESSLSDRKLVQEVFKPDPPSANQARLYFPGNRTTDTWRSRQQGLHLIAQGAFAGIRNVATHVDEEWTEQVALENLAVLSVVARWTDETKVFHAKR
jgi:hypothetical protein